VIFSCNNLESVSPAKRQTFVYYLGGPSNYNGVAAEQVADGGFIVVGDSVVAGVSLGVVVIKMDATGNPLWRKKIDSASANSIKVLTDGYLIIGDRMNIDLNQATVGDQIIRMMRLIKLNSLGEITADQSWGIRSKRMRVGLI